MKSFPHIIRNSIRHIYDDRNIRFSIVLMFIIIAVATQLLSINTIGTAYEYKLGEIAREDIRVYNDIHYINESETEMEKKRAADSVPLVFDKDASVLLEKLKIVGMLFAHVKKTIEDNPPIGTDDMTFQLFSLKKSLPQYLQYSDNVLLELLKYQNKDELQKSIYNILIYIYDNNEMGIVDKEFQNPYERNTNITIRIIINNDIENKNEISKNKFNFITLESLAGKLYNICYSTNPNLPVKTLNAVITLTSANLTPNISFNPEETKRRINEKIISVKAVMGMLKKGQSIVREGDTITTEIQNKINVLNQSAEKSNIFYLAGVFLLHVIFFMIFGFFIIKFKSIFIVDRETSIIIFSLILVFIIYTFFIARAQSSFLMEFRFPFLLPISFITMILSILYNIYLGILVGIYLIFFTAVMTGGDFVVIILAFSSAILGVLVGGDIEKRTDVLRGGVIIGLINSLIIFSVGMMKGLFMTDLIKYIHIPFASGIINSILVLGIFPLYESVFGITTKFKLYELSDLNADIFKMMLVQAPGTYNHSLIVSIMSETACNDIKANHLLARVGAYYHDIGKIEDSGIYIENKLTDPRSERMNTKEYSMQIISHVEKGVALAKKNKLPDTVIKFIREHHGTSLTTFFYHQALENADKSEHPEEVSRADYQYPGPKPHSKETAVVMLADAVEAASRSLHKPTMASMEELVKKIIFNKLNEGEMESSELSMSELKLIEKAFLKILTGIFHTRIEYPELDNVRELEKKVFENGKKS